MEGADNFCIFSHSQWTNNSAIRSADVLVKYILTMTMFHNSGSEVMTIKQKVASNIMALFSVVSVYFMCMSAI